MQCPTWDLHGLVIDILRVVGLGEEEPALEQQADVLDDESTHRQSCAAAMLEYSGSAIKTPVCLRR